METLRRTLRVLPIGSVVRWENNPPGRVAHNRQFQALRDHMNQYGQIDPIDVVESDTGQYLLVRGHRRLAVAIELGWPFLDAWVWFEPFDVVLDRLGPTEWMQKCASGQDRGQIVRSLGVNRGARIMPKEDARIFQWAAIQLQNMPDIFGQMCERFGSRAFAMSRRCITDSWPLARVCDAILRHGEYRDLETKGITIEGRLAILAHWETEANTRAA